MRRLKLLLLKNVYYVVVSDDTRTTEKLDGIDLNLDFKVDLSRHIIVWDGAKFTNYGPFTGMPGETGPKGDVGLSPKLQLYNKNLYYTYKNNAEAITDDNVNDVVGETDSNSKWVKVGIMERENNFDNVNVTINDGNLKLKKSNVNVDNSGNDLIISGENVSIAENLNVLKKVSANK